MTTITNEGNVIDVLYVLWAQDTDTQALPLREPLPL